LNSKRSLQPALADLMTAWAVGKAGAPLCEFARVTLMFIAGSRTVTVAVPPGPTVTRPGFVLE
jgi:hypothetical protein